MILMGRLLLALLRASTVVVGVKWMLLLAAGLCPCDGIGYSSLCLMCTVRGRYSLVNAVALWFDVAAVALFNVSMLAFLEGTDLVDSIKWCDDC